MPPPIYTSKQSSQIQQKINLFLAATDFAALGGTATLTRSAKGVYYWLIAASQTVELVANLKLALRNFNPAVVNYNYLGYQNAPMSINSATVQYKVIGVALTSGTFGISQSDYTTPAAAPVVTDLLAPSALSTAVAANFYSTALIPANPALLPLAADQLTAEAIIVTPAGSTIDFYGVALNLMYNV